MDRSKAEDRKLGEVKAVLQRLQRLSAEPTSVDLQPAASDIARPALLPTRRLAIIAVLVAAALIGILVISYTFVGVRRLTSPPPQLTPALPTISSTPRAALPEPATALQVAVGLMTAGRVQAAREALLRLAPENSADAAWALARSYDPNFLTTVQGADGGPNIAEAARWYRTWHAISVKQGLVADSVSVDRIIRSMR
jgi:hypothetical protein